MIDNVARALLLGAFTCALGQAAIVFTLDTPYTSSVIPPSGYPEVTITNKLEYVEIMISMANLGTTEFIADLVMNHSNVGAITNITQDPSTPLPTTTISYGLNLTIPSGLSVGSDYELLFHWSTNNSNGGADRFNGPEILKFRVFGNTTESDFNVASAQGFYAATHVQGLDGGRSIKLADTTPNDPNDPTTSTPEPSTMAIAGAGLAAVLFGRRHKRS